LNRLLGTLNLAADRKPLKRGRTIAGDPLHDDPSNNHLRAWGPVAVWAALLFLLSAVPDTGPIPLEDWLPVNDTVAHFALYAVLGGLLARGGMRSGVTLPHLALILAGLLYGVSDEWHQSFVPGRDASMGDWLADAAGVGFGYAMIMLYETTRCSETT